MKRTQPLDHDELWARVIATVRPLAGRAPPVDVGVPTAPKPPEPAKGRPTAAPAAPAARIPVASAGAAARPPGGIEPNRRRRIVRGREAVAARLDLHGLDQVAARGRLLATLLRAQAEGGRAVLVVTGKGRDGEGVLRRRLPEWLAEPALREVVAGYAFADRRHGGEGAVYVALKRR